MARKILRCYIRLMCACVCLYMCMCLYLCIYIYIHIGLHVWVKCFDTSHPLPVVFFSYIFHITTQTQRHFTSNLHLTFPSPSYHSCVSWCRRSNTFIATYALYPFTVSVHFSALKKSSGPLYCLLMCSSAHYMV